MSPNLVSLLLQANNVSQIANPSVPALYEDALVYETGSAMTSTGALSAYSGAKTGRSPADKRIVKEPSSEKDVWWGPVNKEMSPEVSEQTHSHTRSPRCCVLSSTHAQHHGCEDGQRHCCSLRNPPASPQKWSRPEVPEITCPQ